MGISEEQNKENGILDNLDKVMDIGSYVFWSIFGYGVSKFQIIRRNYDIFYVQFPKFALWKLIFGTVFIIGGHLMPLSNTTV